MKKLLITLVGAAAAYVAVDANKEDSFGQKKGFGPALSDATAKVKNFASDVQTGINQKKSELE